MLTFAVHGPGNPVASPRSHEETPDGDEDFPVQAGFPGRTPSGRFGCASGRASHVADVQVLKTDQVKPPGEVRAELFAPVSAGVDLSSPEPGDSDLHPGAAARATLGPRKFALEQPKPSLAARTQSRNVQQLAGGKRRACGHAPVQAHDLTRSWSRESAWNGGECDVPAPGTIECYPVGLHASRHGPGPSEPDPAGLRDPNRPGAPKDSDIPEKLRRRPLTAWGAGPRWA